MTFDELDLSDELLDALYDMHFDECTPIQEKAIPVALQGRDLIAVAQTGTGKSAAFLLPVIDSLASGSYPQDSINCVVMSPTRELAQQIDRQMEGFSYFLPVSSVAIYGGTDGKEFGRQERALRQGADVVIATPGRLLAHLQMGYVDLSRVSFFVLDEADRMLDMGFYDDILTIAKQLPKDCQTMMFSATMPPKIQQLAKTLLKDPAEVKIAVSKPTDKVHQSAFVCYEGQKIGILKHIFKTFGSHRVIVFASSKLKVKELTRELRRDHWKVAEMHSDLEQAARDEAMLDFRAGRTDIMIATDIMARGIDIDDITLVVNYDVPREAESYIHRIGRTARAGLEGKAFTLVGDRDRRSFAQIEHFLGYKVQREAIPEYLGDAPAAKSFKTGGRSDSPNRSGRADKPRRANRSKSKNKPRTESSQQATTAVVESNTDAQPKSVNAAKRKRRWHRGGNRRPKTPESK